MLSHTILSAIKYYLYLSNEYLPDSDPVIIPYKVINRVFSTFYDIITWLYCPPRFLREVQL